MTCCRSDRRENLLDGFDSLAGVARNSSKRHDVPMHLKVHCVEWRLGDRGHGFAVGDRFSDWLMLSEDPQDWPAECLTTFEALVTPLPAWEGLPVGLHAHRLDIGPVVAYWESPTKVGPGPTSLTGVLSVDTYRSPPEWPITEGVVTRVRTEHRWYVRDGSGVWVPESADARYEVVTESGCWDHEPVPAPDQARREVWTGVLLDVDIQPSA